MKRRKRVLLMCMLTGIWLFVQSPWTHAQTHSHTLEQAVAQQPACHGAAHPPAPADFAGCCAEGRCDGHCAQLAWTLAAATPRLILRGAFLLTPLQVSGLQNLRQRELFRPPI